MVKYKKAYCKFFGFDRGEYIPCEISGKPAIDISHNDPRGMGGRQSADNIENLMGLAREWHNILEDFPTYYWWFQLVHYHYMITKKPYHETILSTQDPIFASLTEKVRK